MSRYVLSRSKSRKYWLIFLKSLDKGSSFSHEFRQDEYINDRSEIDKYKRLIYHGVPVSASLQADSICQIQPDPGFSDDNNYLKNSFAEAEQVNLFNGLDKQVVIASDGTDLTELVEKAVVWLTEHSF